MSGSHMIKPFVSTLRLLASPIGLAGTFNCLISMQLTPLFVSLRLTNRQIWNQQVLWVAWSCANRGTGAIVPHHFPSPSMCTVAPPAQDLLLWLLPVHFSSTCPQRREAAFLFSFGIRLVFRKQLPLFLVCPCAYVSVAQISACFVRM